MKQIKDYEDYLVGEDGRIYSNKFGKLKELKPGKTHGYLFVALRKNKNTKYKRINRLVAEAFILNPENKGQVNHIDGDKSNNRVENLEWTTPKENMQHAWRTGLIVYTENTRKAASKPVIRLDTYQEFKSATEASLFLGLNTKAIANSIYLNCRCDGSYWRYV